MKAYDYILFGVIIGFTLGLTVEHLERRFQENKEPEITHTPKPQFGTTPPNCAELYGVGKSKEWSACMLVPHVLPSETRREDI